VLRSICSTVVALVTSFVLTFDGAARPNLLASWTAALPERRQQRVRRVAADCAKAVTGSMTGNLLSSVIAGTSPNRVPPYSRRSLLAVLIRGSGLKAPQSTIVGRRLSGTHRPISRDGGPVPSHCQRRCVDSTTRPWRTGTSAITM
jgi:hypothetical protein